MRQTRVLEGRSRMVQQVFWLLMVAGFGLPFSTLHAAQVIARDGETIELEGTIASFEGEDILERPVVYVGLRLDSPVTFTDGLDEKENVRVVKLLPSGTDVGGLLRKYGGMRVRVKGKVLYRWYGPSAAPLSEMVIVEEISAAPK
jgi:hypothetical protein